MVSGEWLGAACVIGLSGAVQAVFGFGFGLIAVPLMMIFLQPAAAVGISMIVSSCCLGALCLRTVRDVNRSALSRLLPCAAVAMPLGAWVLARVDGGWIRILAGTVTLVIGLAIVVSRIRPPVQDQREMSLWWYVPAGMVSGFLAGSVGIPGPPVIGALSRAGHPKTVFRATCVAHFLAIYAISLIWLGVAGTVTIEVIGFGLTLVPVALMGAWAGDLLFARVPQRTFDFIVPALLILSAVAGIVGR